MKVIPFGNRILVKRRKIGDTVGKLGLIYTPDATKDRPTDIAEVVYVPDNTFCDAALLENAETIINSVIEKAKQGDSYAINTLTEFNGYLKLKSIKAGDTVLLSKYVGTDYADKLKGEEYSICEITDIMGLILKGE